MTIHGWEFAGVIGWSAIATFSAWGFRHAWKIDTAEADKNYAAWRAEFEADLSAEVKAKEQFLQVCRDLEAERNDFAQKCRTHVETISQLERELKWLRENLAALQERHDAGQSEIARLTRMLQEEGAKTAHAQLETSVAVGERDAAAIDASLSIRSLAEERDKLKSEKEALEKALFEEIRQKHQQARKKGRK